MEAWGRGREHGPRPIPRRTGNPPSRPAAYHGDSLSFGRITPGPE